MTQARYGSLAREFPDFDAATLPVIPDRFVTAHWHNEAMPHWTRDTHLELWIDYADPTMRETPGDRFMLRWRLNPADWVIEYTEDWSRILGALEHLEARKIAAKWVTKLGGGFHPDIEGDQYVPEMTPDEVRDYEADITRLFALPGDPYQHGLDAMRAAGLPVGKD